MRTLIRMVDRAFRAVLVIFITGAAFFLDGLRMIKYAKCLILLMLVGTSACFAATPFTPRHPDPVHESWRWRFFTELKGQEVSLRCAPLFDPV